MKFVIFLLSISTYQHSFASRVYMENTPTRVQQALESEHGIGSGVGNKDGSCLLCHATSSGGPGNIQSTGFGRDFFDAATRLGISGNGGGSLLATGPNSLQSIFSESTFKNQDSDLDGRSNEREYELNSDPNDIVTDSSGSGGSGGGCGLILPPDNQPTNTKALLLLLLPILLSFMIRNKKLIKKSQS